MEPPILLYLTIGLIAWAFISLGAAVAGLYFIPKSNSEYWGAFWFMNGIWGLIDGIIGWANLITKPATIEFLRNVLAINSGIDLIYITLGTILATRSKPVLKGFGRAILLQGLFLLIFDLIFLYFCYQS